MQACLASIDGTAPTPDITFAPNAPSAVTSSVVRYAFFDAANMPLGKVDISPPYSAMSFRPEPQVSPVGKPRESRRWHDLRADNDTGGPGSTLSAGLPSAAFRYGMLVKARSFGAQKKIASPCRRFKTPNRPTIFVPTGA
jgi:hypothetical protein